LNFNFKHRKGFNKMNYKYEIEQFKKVNDNFNYIQKEFEDIFKIYFNEKNFDKMFNKSLALSDYYNNSFKVQCSYLKISYDHEVEEFEKIAKYKFSLVNEYLNKLIDNLKNRLEKDL
tara:strand:+ start:1156 stop:1506 length:351 start_codon:yes stop_codon:yes gene_type:complete